MINAPLRWALAFVIGLNLSTWTDAQAAGASPWDLNDVSILLPLRSELLGPLGLAPSSAGPGGPLISPAALSLVPELSRQDPTITPALLRVVGARIDPCFPVALGCQRQLRLIWQPIVNSTTGLTTVDASLHSFYELSSSEFSVFALRWKSTLERSTVSVSGLPLQPHPGMTRWGYTSPFWNELRSLILDSARTNRLVRVTFMTLQREEMMWDFGGVELLPQGWVAMAIPRLTVSKQSFINTGATGGDFRGGPAPRPNSTSDVFTTILSRSEQLTLNDAQELRTSAEAIHRIENPRTHSPQSIDCVSCHAAEPARLWAVNRFPSLGLDQSPSKFISSFNINNVTTGAFTSRAVRAFGYQGDQPAVAQRTIHESAVVAEMLNGGSPY